MSPLRSFAIGLVLMCQILSSYSQGSNAARPKLNIATLIEAPYVMLKSDFGTRTGNDRYEGYAVDLIQMLSEKAKFDYEIKEGNFSSFGELQVQEGVSGNWTVWTGLIGEVVKKRADLVLGGLTVTYDREAAADFTTPFMYSGIGIMMKKLEESHLAKQTKIEYGMYRGGSTHAFFKNSKNSIHKTMYEFMRGSPYGLLNSTREGVERVRTGNFAFIGETTTIDYENSRAPCNTIRIGDTIDAKGYAIATQAASPWRERLSRAILQLKEDGSLTNLVEKWWVTKGECQK